MKPAQILLLALVAGLFIVLGIDLYLIIKGGLENTLSWQIWEISKAFPAVPFLVGFVAGHLFFGLPGDPTKNEEK